MTGNVMVADCESDEIASVNSIRESPERRRLFLILERKSCRASPNNRIYLRLAEPTSTLRALTRACLSLRV